MSLRVLITYLLIGAHLSTVYGICGECGQLSGAACISPTTFSPCINGTQESEIFTCPGNLVCADVTSVCVNSQTSTHEADCPYCGVCNSNLNFACINSTSFAYCFGTTTPYLSAVDTCPIGQYCSVNAPPPNYCVSSLSQATCPVSATTAAPSQTTATSSTTITTQAPPTAASICAAKATTGRFPNPMDTTCKEYAYCFLYAGTIHSQFYMCMGVTVFDPALQMCVTPAKYTCPATTAA